MFKVLLVMGAVYLFGCDSEPTVCTGQPNFSVVVRVRDAATGAPAAFGATLVVREGQFADSATGMYNGPDQEFATYIGVVEERPGTYEVAVRKAGYQTWTRSQVTVTNGRCGVSTVELSVLLLRSS